MYAQGSELDPSKHEWLDVLKMIRNLLKSKGAPLAQIQRIILRRMQKAADTVKNSADLRYVYACAAKPMTAQPANSQMQFLSAMRTWEGLSPPKYNESRILVARV
jgi:hypothetical protein